MDKPDCYGSFWGEVNGNIHRSLGCAGTIVDGAIRDVDEMTGVGFKAIARRMCVGHAAAYPVEWNCTVEVFGTKVRPGQLIHADKHGFLVIPTEDEKKLLDASMFMDKNECDTLIAAAQSCSGKTSEEMLKQTAAAAAQFEKNTIKKFGSKGEW
jgi:regulator of RNase E activity RraA